MQRAASGYGASSAIQGAKILEEIADLPGRDLFSWRDREGGLHRIDSGRLNAYLVQITGHSLSAKTFRTWGGSVAAFGEAWKMIQAEERPTIRQMCQVASDGCTTHRAFAGRVMCIRQFWTE